MIRNKDTENLNGKDYLKFTIFLQITLGLMAESITDSG